VTADWLVAGSVWWDGRLRGTGALRLVDGCVAGGPVPVAEVPAGARRRTLPGTVLPGLIDAHGHSALIDLRSLMIDSDGRAVEYVEMLAVPEHLKLRYDMQPEQFESSSSSEQRARRARPGRA